MGHNYSGIAKIGVSPTITDANVQYLQDTDLGIATGGSGTNASASGVSSYTVPSGYAATLNATPSAQGSGYTIGDGVVLVQNATSGTGTGLKIQAKIIGSDGTTAGTGTLKPNAEFIQNIDAGTLIKLNSFVANNGFEFARVAATGVPITATSTADTGTSATGINGQFIVTVTNGAITSIKQSTNVGSLYKVGDLITLGNIAAAFGGGNVAGDGTNPTSILFTVTGNEVFGMIAANQYTVLEGGQGHAASDTVTFSEEGSSVVGTGTLDVATLGTNKTVPSSRGNLYPTAFRNTSNAAGAVEVYDYAGNAVVFSQVNAGATIGFGFSQVRNANTTLAVGEVEILYGDR